MAETPREPDRFDKAADEIITAFVQGEGLAKLIPAALRAEAAEALERAAREAIQVGEGDSALIAKTIAKRIRALKPDPAAAPAAPTHTPYCCADAKAGGPDHSMDCPHFAIPTAPDLRGALVDAKDALEQIWAAIGDRLLGEGPLSKEYAHGVTRKVNAALTQLRFILSTAAAPAAEEAEYLAVLHDMGETRKDPAPAQGAEALPSKANAPNDLRGVVGAYPDQAAKFIEAQEALLRECQEALHEWPGFSRRRVLLAKLAARTTPQTGEGR